MATLDHMASHGDKTMSARLIISESDSPSELLWFLGHGADRIHIATASYPAGVVMALVHKVTSFFLEPELEHQSRAIASAGKSGLRKVVVSDVRPYQGAGHEMKVDDASAYEFLGHYQDMLAELMAKKLAKP